jgi:glycosyltransferase involved in cell wall biosynthesis
MLNILHVIPRLAGGGAEKLVLETCIEMQKRKDIKVLLLIFDRTIDLYPYLSKQVEIVVCDISFKLFPFKISKPDNKNFKKIIKEFKPNIIHTHLFEAEIKVRAELISGVTYVSHLHDNMKQLDNFKCSYFFSKDRILNFFQKKYLLGKYRESGNNFICISEDTYKYIKLTVRGKDIGYSFIPNAIDVNKFLNPSKKESPNKTLIRLINIGSFQDKKNQIFLIQIVKSLIDKNYKVHLEIIGDGENEQVIRESIIENDLEDSIKLLGRIFNVEQKLFNSDIYLHTAYYEPFGLVLIEAMAAGLPVVTLDGKGNRDLIEEGKNGYMIYDQDPEKFAQRIIYLIENKGKYAEISNYCKAYAKKYDIKEYVSKLLVLYKDSMSSTN